MSDERTFGSIGQRIHHKVKTESGSTTILQSGYIVNNVVHRSSGCIYIQRDADNEGITTQWNTSNIVLMPYKETKIKHIDIPNSDNTNWEFKTASVIAIDWDLIISEL